MIMITLLFPLTSLRAESCERTLKACLEYKDAADQHISNLEEQVKLVSKQRDEALDMAKENVGNSSILPWYGWTAIGFLLGTVTVIGVSK